MPTLRSLAASLPLAAAMFAAAMFAVSPAQALTGDDRTGPAPADSPSSAGGHRLEIKPPMGFSFRQPLYLTLPGPKPDKAAPKPPRWGFCDRPYKECVGEMKKRAKDLEDHILLLRRKIRPGHEKTRLKDKDYVTRQLLDEVLLRAQFTVYNIVDLVEWSDTLTSSDDHRQLDLVFEKMEYKEQALSGIYFRLKEYGADFSSYGYPALADVCSDMAERIQQFGSDLTGFSLQELPVRDGPQ